jgi:hypothetical protein
MSTETSQTRTYSDGPYWSQRWEVNEIQFHKTDLHP